MANKVNMAVSNANSSVEQRNKEMLDKKKRVAAETKLLSQQDRVKRLNDNLLHMSRSKGVPEVHV
jgi:hypothetical protein